MELYSVELEDVVDHFSGLRLLLEKDRLADFRVVSDTNSDTHITFSTITDSQARFGFRLMWQSIIILSFAGCFEVPPDNNACIIITQGGESQTHGQVFLQVWPTIVRILDLIYSKITPVDRVPCPFPVIIHNPQIRETYARMADTDPQTIAPLRLI